MIQRYFICQDCGCEATLTDEHCNFLEEHGCSQPPLYCGICFSKRLSEIWEMPGEKRNAICSGCGAETRLHFVPRLERPVFCPKCFKSQNATNNEG